LQQPTERDALQLPLPVGPRWHYNLLWLAEHLLGPRRFQSFCARGEARNKAALERSYAARGGACLQEIERRRDLDAATFRREYLETGTPVVLEGAALDWACTQTWTPEFFARRYGDDPVLLVNAGTEDIGQKSKHKGGRASTLAQVVKGMEAGTGEYARFAPVLADHPELLKDFDHAWLRARTERICTGTGHQFFMGGPGTTTAMHSAIGGNLFVQAHGEKQWWIYPTACTPIFRPPRRRTPFFFTEFDADAPDLDRYPLAPYARGWTTRLKAGDVLFNPPFYWHQVRNHSLSIGVGYRWYALPSIFRASPMQFLLTLLSTNPPMWVGRAHREDFARLYGEVIQWQEDE
jgi:hypothetical protein